MSYQPERVNLTPPTFPYHGRYRYSVKDWANNRFAYYECPVIVVGETAKKYRIKLIWPIRAHFVDDTILVDKKAVVAIGYKNLDSNRCSIYDLEPALESCRACLQKCEERELASKELERRAGSG